jgi:hypothetical protein
MTDAPGKHATVDDAILDLCRELTVGQTISPIDAAQSFASAQGEDHLGWRSHLGAVRSAAIRLADAGQITVYRKGKPADPHDFRGVYRLGPTRQD